MTRALKTAGSVLILALLAFAASLLDSNPIVAETNAEVGQQIIVSASPRSGALIQSAPGMSYPTLDILYEEAQAVVEQGPYPADDVDWYLIAGFRGDDSRGWINGTFLQPHQTEATEPPPAEEPTPGRTAVSRGSQPDGRSFVGTVTGYALRGRTASGMYTQWGVVAVDPRVVPLGSKIQIDGFEETFIAADTGGAVRGNMIDIWFPSYSEAMRFGVQSRRITVLAP